MSLLHLKLNPEGSGEFVPADRKRDAAGQAVASEGSPTPSEHSALNSPAAAPPSASQSASLSGSPSRSPSGSPSSEPKFDLSGRVFARTTVTLPTAVAITMSDGESAAPARTENLSEGGMFIRDTSTAQVGAVVEVEFALPNSPEPIRTMAEIRWVRPGEAPGDERGVGLKFLKIEDGDREKIRDFVGGRAKLIAGVLGLLGALLPTGNADAYTVREAERGGVIRWAQQDIQITVDNQMEGQLGPEAIEAVQSAFATWANVEGAFPPEVHLQLGDLVDEPGYDTEAASNHNTIRYAPDGFAPANGALAVTLITYDADGNVLDADIVVNGGTGRPFSLVPQAASDHGQESPGYDLQNVLAHEVGHFLGFGEEDGIEDSTMYPTSARGEVVKRDLDASDMEGLRHLYDSMGRDAPGSSAGGCAAAGVSFASNNSWRTYALGVAALCLLAARNKRRKLAFGSVGVAMAMLATPPAYVAKQDHKAARWERAAIAEVVEAAPRWESGMIITTLELEVKSATGTKERVTMEVLGGKLNGLTQVVGHMGVPNKGEAFEVGERAGKFELPATFPIHRLNGHVFRVATEAALQGDAGAAAHDHAHHEHDEHLERRDGARRAIAPLTGDLPDADTAHP